jgi:hypothetical protein
VFANGSVLYSALILGIHQKIDLAKLPSAKGAAFDLHLDEHDARCFSNTRVDLLRQIAEWAENAQGKCIFWLKGMAGTGKSMISRTAAQSFADKGQLGGSFFFKRGEGDRGNAARFFTTIAAQLTTNVPSLSPFIGNAIDADPAISEKSLKKQFEKLILQPLSKVQSVSILVHLNPSRTMKLHSSCLIFNLLILIFVSSALGVAIPSFSPPIAEPHEKRDDACGFAGNSDLYGLGIRLGVYFQWISVFIVSGWYKEGREELTRAYLSFVFALMIAMIVVTFQAQPVYAAEILLLTYIIFGGTITVMSASVMSRLVYSKGAKFISIWFVEFWTAMIIYFAASVYCSWFWFYGHCHGFLETPCGTFGFLFTRVSLYNPPITKFFAALSVSFGIIYGCVLLGGLAISILFLFKVPTVVKWVNRYQLPKRPPYHAFAANEKVPAVHHDQEFPLSRWKSGRGMFK